MKSPEGFLHPSLEGYFISTNPARLDVGLIHCFLSEESYWAGGVSLDVVENSIRHSFCFGIFHHGNQVGFARVISDFATFAYLADVFILESHRGKGLSKWLMEVISGHPKLQGLRRWMLATRDAHQLYEKYGFKSLANPSRFMERHFPDIYKK